MATSPATTARARRPTGRRLDAAAAQGVVGLVDFEFMRRRRRLGRALVERLRPAAGPGATYADGLEEVIEAGLRTGDPLPAARRPAHHGAAQDHQRRLAQHPDGLVLRAVRRRAAGWSTRRRGRTSPAPSCARCSPAPTCAGLEVATHAIGDAAVRRRPRRVRRHRRPRLDRARPAGRPRRRTPDGRARPAGQRAARAPARRPRPHRAGLAGASGERRSRSAGCSTTASSSAFGSDAPVSPLDPWLAMAAAVHRSADDRDGRGTPSRR